MKPFTIVISYRPGTFFEKSLDFLMKSSLVERAVIVNEEPVRFKMERCQVFVGGPLLWNKTLRRILSGIQTKYLLLFPGGQRIRVEPVALERILGKAESTKAGFVYSDFYEKSKSGKTLHPLNDYQLGSARDDFDFGAMFLYSVSAIRKALKQYGPTRDLKFAGLYDLRLKVSIDHSVYHLREPLYSGIRTNPSASDKMFAYVEPRNKAAQREMEIVFTDYLKKIGAYVSTRRLRDVGESRKPFAVDASIIVPVRNREKKITEAVKSALSQKTDFSFNIIVVDNHSIDGTTTILSDLAKKYPHLKHVVPERTDLGIGGCWNEALHHEACGRYAVQLDSDDLYSSPHTLQKMVDMLRQGNYAMVIGSYTLVDSELKKIPPGVINHREWTDENGHNNALRINGLGAPRAFNTGVMRRIKFLNVSYGEDYAAALRICREYRIGRIYDSLYLCRRWSGNTDAALSIEERNRNDAFKDKIRTAEILARQKMNQGKAPLILPLSLRGERAGRGGKLSGRRRHYQTEDL